MYRVKTTMTGTAGAPYYNALYFLEGTGSNIDGLLEAVQEYWRDLLEFSDDACIATVDGEVDVVDIATGDITGVEAGTSLLTGGRNTGTLLPPATQGLLRLRTNQFQGGRRIQGKTFIPALATAAGTAVPASSLLGIWNAGGAGLMTASAAANAPWCVYSPTNRVAATITSTSAWGQYAVQRSRRD